MQIEISTTSDAEAAKLTAANQHGHVYQGGLYVVIDDQCDILKSRVEVDALIEQLRLAADELWPPRT